MLRGVGILFNKDTKNALLEWNPVSEWIITAQVKTKYRKMTIVQCYAPTEDGETDEKESFYSLLDKTLVSHHRNDIVLMMGDLNAKVECNNEDVEHVMGKHGTRDCKENGKLLVETCGNHGLMIDGTLFPHKECHKVTWVSPDPKGRTQNQIDHICISKNCRKSLLDVCKKRGADVGSDHHLIMGIMRIYIYRRKKVIVSRRKFDLKKLEHPDNSEQFRAGLQNSIAQIRKVQDGSVEEKWQTIKTTLRNISESTLGYIAKERTEWISNITWDKINRRILLKAQICGSGLLSEEYRSLDNRGYVDGMAEYAQNAADKGTMKELYDTVRKMVNASVSRTVLVKDKNGNIITSVQEQLERWNKHFSEVLNSEYPPIMYVETAQTCPELQISIRPPSKREITEAIKAMKKGKAAGIDNIPPEI
jgi:hypothetical protein